MELAAWREHTRADSASSIACRTACIQDGSSMVLRCPGIAKASCATGECSGLHASCLPQAGFHHGDTENFRIFQFTC